MGRSTPTRTPTRRELLHAALDHIRRTGDVTVPWAEVPGLAVEFRDPEEVLRTLHRRWYASFAARLDALLEDRPSDLPAAVHQLWDTLVAEDPTWRAVLDGYRGHPALARAEERQRQLLSMATAGEVDRLPSDLESGLPLDLRADAPARTLSAA